MGPIPGGGFRPSQTPSGGSAGLQFHQEAASALQLLNERFRELSERLQESFPQTTEFVKRLGEMNTKFADLARGAASLGAAVTTLVGGWRAAITSFVEVAEPGVVHMFNLAVRDLMANVGLVLLPAMQAITQATRIFGDTLAAMSPSTARLVSALVAAGVAMAAAAVFAVALSAAIAVATGGVTGLLSVLAGSLAGAVAFTAVMDTSGRFLESMGVIFENFMKVLDGALSYLSDVFQSMIPVINEVVNVLALLVQGFVKLFASLMASGPVQTALAYAAAIMQYIGQFFRGIVKMLEELGILPKITQANRENANKGLGAAASSVSFQDAQSFARSAYANAYMLGQRTQKETEDLAFQNRVAEALRNIEALLGPATAAVEVVRNVVVWFKDRYSDAGKIFDIATDKPTVDWALANPGRAAREFTSGLAEGLDSLFR